MAGEFSPSGAQAAALELAGRRVTVVGLARSGVAAANLLLACGARVTVTDARSRKQLQERVGSLAPGVELALGGHPLRVFRRADLIVVSPGVPLEIAPLREAKRSGVALIGELELACRFARAPIIAVSGTNGKTTTTALIGALLEAAGLQVTVAGNIGTPFSREVAREKKRDFWVLEVSSFQLEAIESFCPHIALLLNLAPDHLDRYASFADYVAAKRRLFMNQTPQDYAVLNADDPLVLEAAADVRARRVLFSRCRELPEGVMVQGGRIMAKLNGVSREICAVDELGMMGVHNLENALAATAASVICGMPSRLIRKILKEFEAPEHRLEFVTQIRGVDFVNDSKATNVGALLKSLAGFKQPVVLIAGGRDKEADFSPLLEAVREKVRRVVLIGEAREKIKKALVPLQDRLQEADSLPQAVRLAFRSAKPGDVVLLSPACASFDMFKDYEERGWAFKAAVFDLERER